MDQLCQQTSMANKSWLLWLSGESQSTYLHFLDLIELLHYTLD
jgi:site-specific DNA-cytosine methylase